jgi:hypothetical protein
MMMNKNEKTRLSYDEQLKYLYSFQLILESATQLAEAASLWEGFGKFAAVNL